MATEDLAPHEINIHSLVQAANDAFRTTENDTGCGPLEYSVVFEDGLEHTFLIVDLSLETLTLSPTKDHAAGEYTGSLKFFFTDFPDRMIEVPFTVLIEQCSIE